MLIAAERLLLKVRQPRSRADEVIALRARLRGERLDDAERALALEVHARKLEVAAEVGAVSACGSCASGLAWPVGAHAGGACCSGVTEDVIDSAELAALAGAGTRARDLEPPSRAHPHAGCAFRGADSCSLALEHRPARCVHFVCDMLRRELHARGRLDEVEARLAALSDAMQRFTAAHRARCDRDVLAPLVDALSADARRRARAK